MEKGGMCLGGGGSVGRGIGEEGVWGEGGVMSKGFTYDFLLVDLVEVGLEEEVLEEELDELGFAGARAGSNLILPEDFLL
mmetsp:Transcript_30242/g.46917  ORF Transcript_30242/g.46917 Transcript_30242/m.46917 type:complete len:80 (+) Transcript_30242:189-428(+)